MENHPTKDVIIDIPSLLAMMRESTHKFCSMADLDQFEEITISETTLKRSSYDEMMTDLFPSNNLTSEEFSTQSLLSTCLMSAFYWPQMLRKVFNFVTPVVLSKALSFFSEDKFWRKKQKNAKLVAVANMSPHPEKAATGGEDAFFIGENSLGVADGVGGWSAFGIDPSVYARKFMNYSQQAFTSTENPGPQKVLEGTHSKLINEKIPGSSCVLLMKFSPLTKELEAVSVGDSAFKIIRDGRVISTSPTQQHYFNCPYQLGYGSDDSPKDSIKFSFTLEENDIIVVGTDGFFDNVWDHEIEKVITEVPITTTKRTYIVNIAEKLLRLAKDSSTDPLKETPFSFEAKKNGLSFQGGKQDDITLLVASVASE